MVKEIEINGKKMTAVILGETWGHDAERYRESLLSVIGSSLLNEDGLGNGFPSGSELYDCITLARALEQKPVLEKGGIV